MGVLGRPYFRGQSINRLDSKGRLRIPTKFRDILQHNYTDALIITAWGECLIAYPPEAWDTVESKAVTFSQVDLDHRAFMRQFISSAVECEFDKQGRILIPPVLRQRAKLDQEVMLAGMLTNFEIWSKEAWEQEMNLSATQYQQIATKLAEFGL